MNEQFNQQELNLIIWHLRSVYREKTKYKSKLDKLTTESDFLDWYFKSCRANPYMINKACEILNIDPNYILRKDAILLGSILIKNYKTKIELQIFSLEKAIARMEEDMTKDIYFKHNK